MIVNESHKLITGKFQKCKVYSSYRDKIWGTDLSDIQMQ